MEIRKYKESDFSALCDIFLRSVKETASRDYSPAQIAAWAQIDTVRWRNKLAHSQTWVAVINGQLVGFITLIDGGYIDLLFVAPEYGRRGVAAALLNQLDSGGALTVDASITAKPFFERRGFRVVQQQSVALRGQHFINFHLRRASAK